MKTSSFRRVIDSTHACALRLIEQAENEEIVLPTTIIIAGEQDNGQGRAGRTWVSPPGGLYLSWIVANLDPKTIAQLPMIAAAAAHEALSRPWCRELVIKWPNDLLVDGRKLAGLLVHARHGETTWVAVGSGSISRLPRSIEADGTTRAVAVADLVTRGRFLVPGRRPSPGSFRELDDGSGQSRRPHRQMARVNSTIASERDGGSSRRRLQTRGLFAGLTDEGHLRLNVAGEEQIISTGDVIE